MPTVPPSLVLLAVVLLTAGVALGAWLVRRIWQRRLGALARDAGGFLLGDVDERHLEWVVTLLPAVSPGSVRLRDAVEVPRAGGAGEDTNVTSRRVVLRADYTVGTTHGRRNRTRIVAATLAGDEVSRQATAPVDEERLAQYRMLLEPSQVPDPHPVAEVTRAG